MGKNKQDRDGLHRRPNTPQGIWYFYYRTADGHWHEKSTATCNYSQARGIRTAALEKIQSGQATSQLSDWLLRDAAHAWAERKRALVQPVAYCFYRRTGPAPPVGGRRLPKWASKWADKMGKKWGNSNQKYDAGHLKPHSQTPPGEPVRVRPQPALKNRGEGRSIAESNAARRSTGTAGDPNSPMYTRAKESSSTAVPESKSPAAPTMDGSKSSRPADVASPKPDVGTAPPPKPPGDVGPPKPPVEPVPPKFATEPVEPKLPVEPHAPRLSGAGRILGAIGEVLMVRDIARDLERLHNRFDDSKYPVGSTYTDMFGNTYKKFSSTKWVPADSTGA